MSSNKQCQHNNHSHILIWILLWMTSINSCVDCSGERTRMDNRVRDLEAQVRALRTQR